VKRAWPYLLFAAITLFAFRDFLLRGYTLYDTQSIRVHRGVITEESSTWFASDIRHGRVTDNVLLLPSLYRVYNEGLKAGELRLWNPSLFCGYPVYNDPMAHPFYPPNLVLHLLFGPETAFGLVLLLHLFFSGCATFWALRAMGRSDAAAALGGVAWMLLGYNAMWFSSAILLGSAVFGPLALRALVRGVETKDLRGAAWAGLAMGMVILGSHPQHAVHVFIFLVAWLAAAAARDPASRGFLLRFSTLFAALSIGVGLAAVLTRLDSIVHGRRLPGPDLDVLYGSAFESLSRLTGLATWKCYAPRTPIHHFEFIAHAGLALTALAVAGAVRGFREPATRFLALFGAGALLVAFVRPLAVLVQQLPILNLSPPTRWIYVAGFCLAFVAARGVDELAARPEAARRLSLALVGVTVAFLVLCAIGLGPYRLGNGAALETLIGFVLATIAACAASRRARLGLSLGIGAVLFELLPIFMEANAPQPPEILRDVPEPLRDLRESDAASGPWRATGSLSFHLSTPERISPQELMLATNALSVYGIDTPGGFEAIIPAHFVDFATAAGARVDRAGRAVVFLDYAQPLLDVMGVRHLLLPLEWREPGRWRLRRAYGTLNVYENPSALPRAWMVSGAMPARDSGHALELLREPGFDPRRTVILEALVPASPPGAIDAALRWKSRTSDHSLLEVRAPRGGHLVVSETDYPGWEARLDGARVPIARANGAFRAVAVPEGVHEVEFRFRPEPARHGVVVSLLFAAGAAAFALRRRGA
jgi:hypothetical protein